METVQMGLLYMILLVGALVAILPAEVMTGRLGWGVGSSGLIPGWVSRTRSGVEWIMNLPEEGIRGVMAPDHEERCSLTKWFHFPKDGFCTLPCSCMGRNL